MVNNMDQQKALKNLVDVRDVLIAMDLKYFLIDGTLLGAVREKDFIAHDQDIDLGVFGEDWSMKTLREFENRCRLKGLPFHKSYGIFGQAFEQSVKRDGIKLDLFFYWRRGDKRIFHAFKGPKLDEDTITYEYPVGLIENLAPMEFKGEVFSAPAYFEKVLIAKYGPDWRIPVVKWDWKFGPRNVVKN